MVQTRQANLSRLMRYINGITTQQFNRRHGLVGLDHQVVVVAHQAVSQHLGAEPIHCLGDHRQMTLAILVVAVNRLTPVAARCDVVDGVGEFAAQGAGRGVVLRGRLATGKT